MSQILNETKLDYIITTREVVTVTITGVPTHFHEYEGETIRSNSFGVALRLEQLVKAVVAQDGTPGRAIVVEFVRTNYWALSLSTASEPRELDRKRLNSREVKVNL